VSDDIRHCTTKLRQASHDITLSIKAGVHGPLANTRGGSLTNPWLRTTDCKIAPEDNRLETRRAGFEIGIRTEMFETETGIHHCDFFLLGALIYGLCQGFSNCG